MDSFEKFTSCMRKNINLIIQEKRGGLIFYTQYDISKRVFRYPKYSMVFSCPEGSPERLEPYTYMSKEKVLFGVIANFTDEIKKRELDKYMDLKVVYKFDTGDCYVYIVDKDGILKSATYIPYTLLRSSDESHKVLPKDKIIENYNEFFNIVETAIDTTVKALNLEVKKNDQV